MSRPLSSAVVREMAVWADPDVLAVVADRLYDAAHEEGRDGRIGSACWELAEALGEASRVAVARGRSGRR
jgi:hypothetical protein